MILWGDKQTCMFLSILFYTIYFDRSFYLAKRWGHKVYVAYKQQNLKYDSGYKCCIGGTKKLKSKLYIYCLYKSIYSDLI